MKKKILSLLLACVMVFGVFIPVNFMPETEIIADAATTYPTTKYAPIEIDTYQELDEALRQAYNGMVLKLTADLTVGANSKDYTLKPDMANATVVLDLNGHDITYTQLQNTNFKGIDLYCSNSNFYIINSVYDHGDEKATIGGVTTGFSFIYLENSTASCYIGPGVEIKGSSKWALVCLDFFKNFIMYESDITVNSVLAENTTDCIMIDPGQGNCSVYNNSTFQLNRCDLTTKRGDCIDLQYVGTFTANTAGTMKFKLNHTRLFVNDTKAYAINLSHPTNASSNVEVGSLSFNEGVVTVAGYLPSLGTGRGEGNYNVGGKIQNVYSGCDLYFFNSLLRKSVAAGGCAHSAHEDIFACSVSSGHVRICTKCQADFFYSGHTYKNYKAPTADSEGNTGGYGCACGYTTYYKLPAETPINPFSNVTEVATWSSLALALNTTKPTTIKLKSDITVDDDNNSYTITPKVRGNLVIDLNGYDLTINSDKTKYLFDLSKATYGELGTNLSIVSSTEGGGGDVVLNTNQKGAAVVMLANKANSFTASRVGIILGTETDVTTDAYAQTFAIDCSAAHQLNIYTADVYNYKQNGTAIRFNSEAANTFNNTTVRIYRSAFKFKTFGIDFNNSAAVTASSFKDFTISNNNYFTPLNSTAKVLDINGSSNTIKLSDIVDTDFHFVDGTYSVSPDKTVAYDNFTAGKEYWTKWRWNSSNQCAHTDFVTVLYAEFGSYQYCTRCKKAFAQDHHIIVDGSRTTYADCENDGEIFYICDDTGCGYEYSVKDISTGHVPHTDDEGEDIIYNVCPATCEKDGVKQAYYECIYCDQSKPGYILAETNEWVPQEYYDQYIHAKKLGHMKVDVTAKPATCAETGYKDGYYVCIQVNGCGCYFDKSTGLEVPASEVVIPRTSHNVSLVKGTPATCTVNGTIDHYKCSTCSKLFSDSAAKKEITDITDKATGHSVTKVKAVKPTCTKNGTIEHYKCSKCSKLFSDSAAKKEITNITDKASGHSYSWVVTKEAKVGVEGEKANKCKTCGDVKETQKIPALEPEYILGDVDMNGEVKAADARLALRASVGLETLSATQKKAADADKNGEIKAADARLILRCSVGLETLK